MSAPHALSTAPAARAGLDLARIRADFPILHQRIHGKPLVYLDNAASVQKPKAVIDAISDKPLLRTVTLRLPRALWPVPKAYGHVIAFNEEGTVTADLQNPTGAYPETTAVTETPERLYIQSLHAKGLGWLAR